ncbi:hypothetical protein Tco_1434395, partial [Tanacetum coccineum]
TRSIGLPHKEAAAACCDEVDPLAKVVGEAVKGTDDVKGTNDVHMSNDGEVVLDFLQAIRATEKSKQIWMHIFIPKRMMMSNTVVLEH